MAAPQYGLPTLGGAGIDPSIGNAGSSLFSTAGHGPPPQQTTPTAPQPSIAYNPVENSMFVNGQTVKMDDYAALANSPLALTHPPVPKPQGENWHDVPMSSYEGVINGIKDPTLTTVAKRNFQQALYGMQEIGYGAIGAVSGATGATDLQDWAGRGAARANTQQERFAPFNYQFGSGPDDSNVKAFVGAIAQAVPWMAESIVSGALGAGAALGARSLVMGAARKAAAGAALTQGEKSALVAASRQAAYRGSLAGIGTSSYGTGVGDVYNESVQGGQPDPTGALLRGIPYGLTDALPEAGALALGLGKLGAISKYVGGKGITARVGMGAAGGAIGEGVNEAIQEAILVDERNSVQPGYSDSAEYKNSGRILQSGLGGAAPGMLFGGIAGGVAPKHKPIVNNPNAQTDLLKVAQDNVTADQQAAPAALAPTGPIDYQPTPIPAMPPGQMSLMSPSTLPFTNPTGTPPFERQVAPAANPRDFALQEPYEQFNLTPPQPGQNRLQEIQARQGVNPDQRQAGAPPLTGPSLLAGEQLHLLPDPAQVIPQGQQSLLTPPDRRGAGVYNPLAVTPVDQTELKFPKQKVLKQAGVVAPQKGKEKLVKTPQLAPVSQPAVAVSATHVAPLTPISTPIALKKSPQLSVTEKAILSPPVKVPSVAVTNNDAEVENHFAGEKFAQSTLAEAQAVKQEMQYYNSIQQAITKKPDLEQSIRSYVEDVSPGAIEKYDQWVEGDKSHDALISRGRKVASLNVEKVSGRMVARTQSTEKAANAAVESTPESKLHDLIRNKHNLESKGTFVSKVKEIYSKTTNKSAEVAGHKLSDYFTGGEPNVIRTNNRNVLVPFEPTKEKKAEFAQREKALREEINSVAQEVNEESAAEASRIANDYASDQAADAMSDDAAADKWNTNSYVSADTGEPVSGMTVGRVRLKVANIISKFKIQPKVLPVGTFNELPTFIRNELKERGDDKHISGVSFRDQVYIVADKIYSDDHLRSVLLHEVLGHFGLRSVVDGDALKTLLTDIYDNDPIIRAEADALADSGRYKGRENWQLVEEALAERAPEVPNNIIQRLWNVIKKGLRGMGFDVNAYNDPGILARGLLNASYRYVRDGAVTEGVQVQKPSSWANDILASVNPAAASTLTAEEAVMKNIAMGGWNQHKGFGVDYVKNKFAGTNVSNLMRGLINEFKTQNQIARQNGGFARFMEVMQRETRRIHELLNQYNDDTKLLHSKDFSPADQAVLQKLLSQTTRSKLQSLSDSTIRDLNLLVTDADGAVTVDREVYKKLQEMGRFSVADFAKGIEIQYKTDRALTAQDQAEIVSEQQAAIKRLDDTANARIAAASDPNIKKDIIKQLKRDTEHTEAKYKAKLDAGVITTTHKLKSDPIQLDPEGSIWKAYNVARDGLDAMVLDVLLSRHKAHKADAAQIFENSLRKLEALKRGEPARVTRAFAKDIAAMYRSIMLTNMVVDQETGRTVLDSGQYARADTMINAVGRALYKDEALKDLLPYFPPEHVAKLTEQIHQIREFNKNLPHTAYEKNTWNFIAGLRTQFTELLGMDEAEMYAKRAIGAGHTALRRYGDYEVNITLRDAKGNAVTPSDNWNNNLVYMRFPDQGSGESAAQEMNAALKESWFDVVDDHGQSVTVTPTAFARAAETIGPLGHKMSLYDYMTVTDQLGIHLSPTDREKLVKAMTKADSKARQSLQRGGNPGEDKDIVRVVSEQLESGAHIVSSNENKRELDRIMADDQVWFGDPAQKAAWETLRDQTPEPDIKKRYQKLVDKWNLEYGKASKNGYYYKSLANNLREWRSQQTNLLAKEENKVMANTKSAVSAMQLGGYVGNMASALVQLFTLVTHVPAYLATYNSKTAFGGGFGMARAYTAVVAASKDVGPHAYGKIGGLKEKLDKNMALTDNERKFMFDETKEGVFQAAQFNALMNSKLGTLRMFGQSNKANDLLQKWMQFFSWSEEANRRVTGLAAYRLFYDRALQEGATAEEAHLSATAEARQAVYQTQGDYTMMNRPAWARSGFTSLLFMYKMFPILTIQMVRNLPMSGRIMFLGTMGLLGGFKSLPFAEDLLDILDGLVQRTGLGAGLTRGNADLALREFVDTFFPGMSPLAARGLLDYMTNASLSSRIGVGDIIPGTGVLRAGGEVGDLQGPAGGVVAALYKMTTEALHENYGRAMREVPITAVKNIIEGYIYLNNGAILNKQGHVVANDPSVTETIGRFMGFYPSRQAQSNELVQAGKISINYAKEIKGDFVSRYVLARMDGDMDKVAKVQADVAAWNQDARGTEVEIIGFGEAAGKAYIAAKRPQIDTFLRSSPIAVRRERDHIKALYGVSN